MTYRIVYHPDVVDKDLPRITANVAGRITRAVAGRLTIHPPYYGEALRHRYKGYWKFRVGDYRVIYKIVGQEVWVYRVGHRRDVYTLSLSRLSWSPS